MWPQSHFGAYMSNALTCGLSWDNSWHGPNRFTLLSLTCFFGIWMIHLYFRPHTWKSSTQIAKKNCKQSKLWTSRFSEFSALRTWRSACLWALRSQRSGNASWPRNRSASTEDGELDHKKLWKIQMSTKSNKSTTENTETVAASIIQTWLQFWLCEWCGPVLVLYLQDNWSKHITTFVYNCFPVYSFVFVHLVDPHFWKPSLKLVCGFQSRDIQ